MTRTRMSLLVLMSVDFDSDLAWAWAGPKMKQLFDHCERVLSDEMWKQQKLMGRQLVFDHPG